MRLIFLPIKPITTNKSTIINDQEDETMFVISLLVKNEFGVMQRVMGEFTRNKINVETIVVGKCEKQGRSRMVLSVIDENEANLVLGRL